MLYRSANVGTASSCD